MDNKLLEKMLKQDEVVDFTRVLSLNPEYKRLLEMFCDNKELQNLINYALIDIKDGEEEHYITNGSYPLARNPLMKLKYDLEFVRKKRIEQQLIIEKNRMKEE